MLRSVGMVIIGEITPSSPPKRAPPGLSLERLEALVEEAVAAHRVVAATQRPLDEVARFLGGRLTGKK